MKGKPLAGSRTSRASEEPRSDTPTPAWTAKSSPVYPRAASVCQIFYFSDSDMELHRVHKTFHHSHLGEEKSQMLNLNRRLETYLSRVKLLEEENELLAKEIQALRRSDQGVSMRRRGLEDELQKVRVEVDAAWRDRAYAELEVGRLIEELQNLDQQRQREAQAKAQAKTKLEQSKKELEEERRAQMWLREKVRQLEQEMRHLIETHQEDVAHIEATLTHSRATAPPTLAQRGIQTANLLQLGQEYSQGASRAWQEAAEAYQGQLDRLEESLHQTRGRLTQVGQEKSESQLRLRALEKELASAQDVRQHLEKTAAQQGLKYSQEVQQVQEHLEGLEAEKADLGQQMDRLLLETRGLMQVKMSLSLEVATYRALLDGESLRGDTSLLNQPRNISVTDAVFSPRGVEKNYPTQLSARHKTTSLSSVCHVTGPRAMTATPGWSKKPASLTETPKMSMKPAYEDTSKSPQTPYPKILQDGAVESFRPQEVNEKVTYAEPLSPPDEEQQETQEKDGEEDLSRADVEPAEQRQVVAESVVGRQLESGLGTEPPSDDHRHQFPSSPTRSPYDVSMAEEPFGLPAEPGKDVLYETPAEKEDMHEPRPPVEAWEGKECKGQDAQDEETSDSETEAVLEPNSESRSSSPVSEYEPDEHVVNKVMDLHQDGNMLQEDAAEMKQEISLSVAGTNETDVEEMLYPDGEEMDTWDSVIERKVDLKTDDGIRKDKDEQPHAEPEEDISAREQEQGQRQDTDVHDVTSQGEDDDGQRDADDQDRASLVDKEEDDEEEDSQNISVSWRTELESDSYAQDNTLADTRPLIRYKSDETDGNTQASHMDESESSEGEPEKKIGETGSGTWSEGKSKKFGTMEDLCEEVEVETLNEEYDLGYTHTEESGVNQGMTAGERATPGDDRGISDETIRKASEEHSDEETEELAKPAAPTHVVFDEELDTDRLVEQELENLATESYSAHFAQQQLCESEQVLHLQHSVEEVTEEEENGRSTEDTYTCEGPEEKETPKLVSSAEIIDQPYESLRFRDPSEDPTDCEAEEEVQQNEQEAPEKREEEDEPNVSMATHADAAENQPDFSDFPSRPELEEIDSAVQVTTDQENLPDVTGPAEVKEVDPAPEEHLTEEAANHQGSQETTEWDVQGNLSEDFENKSLNEDDEECDNLSGSADSDLCHDGGSVESVVTQRDEQLEISPEAAPDDNDIFAVRDSAELLDTKDDSLHDFFSAGVKNDFWVSSLETGATYQPDDACNEAAEQTKKNLGFADSLVWGGLDTPDVVSWNSRADADPSKAPAARVEQKPSEGKQVLSRKVLEGDLVHSEDSEVEGESWSSGEEPV